MTSPPGHSWRDTWSALSGPLSDSHPEAGQWCTEATLCPWLSAGVHTLIHESVFLSFLAMMITTNMHLISDMRHCFCQTCCQKMRKSRFSRIRQTRSLDVAWTEAALCPWLSAGARTLIHASATLNLEYESLNPKAQSLHPKFSTLHPPYTLNPKPYTSNPKPQTPNPKPSTLYLKSLTLNPKP